MTYSTDDRYGAGASGVTVPAEAPAAYAARWIDRNGRAELLLDRQGFAYNDFAARNTLIDLLTEASYHLDMPRLDRDVVTLVTGTEGWRVWMRRAGGYVYVDAWLAPVVAAS